jgi:hypothetical protein
MSSATMPGKPRCGGVSFRNQKLVCLGTFLLVFLCGVLAGAAIMTNSSLHQRFHRSAPFWTEAGKQISLENWKAELNLTPAQTEEMASILEDFAKYYRSVTSEAKARILKILDDEQRRKFEKLLGQARH